MQVDSYCLFNVQVEHVLNRRNNKIKEYFYYSKKMLENNFIDINEGMFLVKHIINMDGTSKIFLFIDTKIYYELFNIEDDLPPHDECFLIEKKSYQTTYEDIRICERIINEYFH